MLQTSLKQCSDVRLQEQIRATSGYSCDHKGFFCSDLIYPCRLAASGPIKATLQRQPLKPVQHGNTLHMQAGRPHFISAVVEFPSSYSNDPILIHTGTPSNWCQVSDFYIHQQSTSNKPWCPSQHHLRLHWGVAPARQGRGQVYLFNWDGSPAPDAVRTALQAFLLFVWVAPFPRLQAKVKLAFGQGLWLSDGSRPYIQSSRQQDSEPTPPAVCLHWLIIPKEFSKLSPWLFYCEIIF